MHRFSLSLISLVSIKKLKSSMYSSAEPLVIGFLISGPWCMLDVCWKLFFSEVLNFCNCCYNRGKGILKQNCINSMWVQYSVHHGFASCIVRILHPLTEHLKTTDCCAFLEFSGVPHMTHNWAPRIALTLCTEGQEVWKRKCAKCRCSFEGEGQHHFLS